MGINPTFRVSNAKASSAKRPIKSSSPTKVASLAKVGSSANRSSTNKLLFISKEESFTKSPARQNAPEPATRQLPIVYIPLATNPTALECILEVFKPVEFNIDLNNLHS